MKLAMTSARWAKVIDTVEHAMEMAPEERRKYLDEACSSDPEFRIEVESLLAADYEAPDTFMSALPHVGMLKGARLGDFEIQSLIGTGGMGEVYCATDLRLHRDVAIKILPLLVALDPDRLRRFEREALAVAALNHPNILSVYQFGEHEQRPYLVTELLRGETLRETLARGPIPVSKAIEYSLQIALGLTAAHASRIIHRDLKPENLFVCDDGCVKILDFGLAKVIAVDDNAANAPQMSGRTDARILMGTLGYMAPEQLRGQTVDERTDIFAFGAILYEIVTGERAFQSPTPAEGIAAILNERPLLFRKRDLGIPPELERIVIRCLEKEPESRFQSSADLSHALRAVSELTTARSTLARRRFFSSASARNLGLCAVSVAIVLGVWTTYSHFHKTPKLPGGGSIVLAQIDNKTGDAAFDDALNQELSIRLEQSPFLQVVSDGKIARALKLMGRASAERLTPELAKEVCVRTGSKAVLQTTISNFGSDYLLGIVATACVTGDKLVEDQHEASDKKGVLKAIDSMASEIRAKLGESIDSVQKFDYHGEATTPSLDALKAFAVGNKVLYARGPDAAILFFKQSVALDPQFAKGYLALGKMYASLGEPELAERNVSKAYSLSGHVTEVEKLDITAEYEFDVAGDLSMALQTFDAWADAYPRDPTPLHNRANIFMHLGQYEKAIEGFEHAKKLMPDFVYSYVSIAFADSSLGHLADAKASLDALRPHGFDPEMAWPRYYEIAFLQNNSQEMDRQLSIGLNRPQDKGDALWYRACADFYHGRVAKARDLFHRAALAQVDSGFNEHAAAKQARVARQFADSGIDIAAKSAAETALSMGASRWSKAEVATVFAEIGEAGRAKALIKELRTSYPSDTILNRYWLPVVNASLLIRERHALEAISTLGPATDYELGGSGPIYPAYVRGCAYLAAHNGPAAVTEFQKLIDHPGIVFNDATGALARRQLGRAYALMGDRANARKAFEAFFELWKDADPNIPVLKQAKTEYAKLLRSPE